MQRLIALGLIMVLGMPAQAALVSVSGPLSNLGDSAAIIAAPTDVNDDAAFNTAQQGFNERQSVVLSSDLAVDGGFIGAGTTVDSHMIFLNTGPGNNGTLAEHFNVNWTFSDIILGVMSGSNGALEVASSSFLDAAGTLYPNSPFSARGLEGNNPSCRDDCYSFVGNVLNLTMRVTEPGDWIRVITASSVPEPFALFLLAAGLVILTGVRKLKYFL